LKTLKLTLFAASLVLLGACASEPEKTATVVPPPKNVTLDELNKAVDAGKQIQNEKGEEVICRREAKVGSRLARETICMTRAEWLKVSEESQRATRRSMKPGRIPHGT
jgi:hypothetical protein